MKIVISIGGSLITSKLTPEGIIKYVKVIKELKERGHKVVVVVGGGKTARSYIDVAKELTSNKSLWDEVGILATRMNAMLFLCGLGENAYPKILDSPREVVEALLANKIVVCGGHEPGGSTDLAAAMIAERMQADVLINATDVNGVYDSDPKKNPNAKKFERLTYDEFFDVLKNVKQEPGYYTLFDLSAIPIIKRSRIRTIVIDGRDPKEILKAVEGKHSGTVIE